MQIVIDMPEEVYNSIQDNDYCGISNSDMYNAIVNGTPLKDHGKLIDADEVVKEICIDHKVNSIYELSDELRSFVKKYLSEVPTILKPTQEYMIKNYAFSKKVRNEYKV